MEKTVRERLIIEMFKALSTQGYHGCNLNAILQRAGTSKGGMYHHFSSKKELALAAMQEVLGTYICRYWEEPLQDSENPLQTLVERIESLPQANLYLDQPINFYHGSPLNSMMQELAASHSDFSRLFQELLQRWEEAIIQSLTRARKLLRIDVDIREAASFIVSSIEGSFGYAKVYGSKEEFIRLMHQLRVYIQALVRD